MLGDVVKSGKFATDMNDMPIKTESVRIEAEVLNRVREHVKDTRQTLGGFISYELEKIMNRIDKKKDKK